MGPTEKVKFVFVRYRVLSAHSQSYTEFTLNPGCREAVVVVGGETEVFISLKYSLSLYLSNSLIASSH